MNFWVTLITFVASTAMAGALLALTVRRYVLITGTAFLGAWATLVGTMALTGNAAAMAAVSGDVSLVFPIAPLSGQVGFVYGWAGPGLVAALVQLRSTSVGRAGEPRARAKKR